MKERRYVTVLFADLVEFTRLCDRMDPEDVDEIIEDVMNVIKENTLKYKGKLIKIIGDCALCVFGAPIALENSCENALLAILQAYKDIDKLFHNYPYHLQLHTGIHVGEVLFEITKDGKIDVLGGTVNIASRLKDVSGPGEVFVSEDVYKRTRHAFEFVEIGERVLKGVEKPVLTYKLVNKKTQPKEMRGFGVELPLIGRERELIEMARSFEDYKEKKRDFLVLIVGEPGIGKTRLYKEFKKNKEKDALILEGYASSTQSQPFQPIKMLFEDLVRKRGPNVFNDLFPDGKVGDLSVEPFINSLLEDKTIENRENLSSEKFKRQKFFVFESILREISHRENLLLCLEDLHWADKETTDFIRSILLSPNNNKGIFIIVISRPPVKNTHIMEIFEFFNSVKEKIEIKVRPLNSMESMELIKTALNVEKLPESFKREILLKRSEGNPLFLEEMVKMLIERGIIYRDGEEWKARIAQKVIDTIPVNLTDIILSRFDLLNNDEKEFLKVASVIGNVFSEKDVRYLAKTNLRVDVDRLVKIDFIKPVDTHFFQYEFKHILVREVIYKTLLKRERRYYHLEFARYLEDMLKDGHNISEGLIAEHFEKGGDLRKSFVYNEKYAYKCMENHMNFESIRLFKKILNISNMKEEFSNKRYSIYYSLGTLYNRIGNFKESIKFLDRALALANTDKDKVKTLIEISNVFQRASQYEDALFYLKTAQKYVGDYKDLSLSLLLSKLWITYLMGNLKKCKYLVKKCEEVLDTLEDGEEKEYKKAQIENIKGSVLSSEGNLSEALVHYKNALKIYDRLNNISGKGVIFNNLGSNLYRIGKIEEAIRMLNESLKIEKNTGNYLGYAITCNNLGEMYLLIYKLKMSKKFFQTYLKINSRIRNRLGDGYGNLGLAEIYKREKKLNEAEKCYKESIRILKEVKSEDVENRAKACLANFYIENGREEEGFELINEIKEFARKYNHYIALYTSYLLFAGYYLVRFKKTKEDGFLARAKDNLDRARDVLNEKISDRWAPIEYYRNLIEYYKLEKNEKEYENVRRALYSLMKNITSNIENPENIEGIKKHMDYLYFVYP